MPKKADNIIQKAAPGPPDAIAVAQMVVKRDCHAVAKT
jgi:hypothetical protein